jgi:hypothetical protein
MVSPHPDPPVATRPAQPEDRHDARRRAEALVAGIDEARRLHDEAHAALRAAAHQRRNELVWQRLDELPLAALRDAGGAGLRLSAFEQAGITSVGALARWDATRLDAEVEGVGPATATQALEVARKLYHGVAPQVRVLPDPATPDASGAALLAALARYEHVLRAFAALQPLWSAHQRLSAVLPTLEHAGGRLRWAFSGRRHKDAALAAAGEAFAVLDDPVVTAAAASLPAAVQSVRAWSAPTEAALWQDYVTRGADYAAVLERAGTGLLTAAVPGRARGGLAADIAARVDATPVDTAGLTANLRGYQEFGVRYVIAQQRVILGDEMGLGKTIQALGAMCHLRNAEDARHFLVVAPASILQNWVREVEHRTDLVPHVLHGTDRDEDLAAWVAAGGVGITSYDTLRLVAVPPALRPELVVVDEAHYVKNPAAQRSQAVAAWLAACERVLLLSGTPMENRLGEFTRLVSLAQPEVAARLGSEEAQLALVGADTAGFRELVSPVYLRRNQADVLVELPERIEVEEWVELSGDDLAAYRATVVAGELMAMRQCATLGAGPARSAKLERLAELLEAYRDDGRKVLVFSFFRRVLDAVAGVGAELTGSPVVSITGDVAPAQRFELIDAFSAAPGFGVLACQVDAAGVGLNLQAASAVVLIVDLLMVL